MPDLEALKEQLQRAGFSDAASLWLAGQAVLLGELSAKIEAMSWPESKISAAKELLSAFDCRWNTYDCGCSGCSRRRMFLKAEYRRRAPKEEDRDA